MAFAKCTCKDVKVRPSEDKRSSWALCVVPCETVFNSSQHSECVHNFLDFILGKTWILVRRKIGLGPLICALLHSLCPRQYISQDIDRRTVPANGLKPEVVLEVNGLGFGPRCSLENTSVCMKAERSIRRIVLAGQADAPRRFKAKQRRWKSRLFDKLSMETQQGPQ